VKIDRSFVSDLCSNTSSNIIVQAVILIAGGLGIRTVAEGIETDEQLRLLKLLGCKEVQGYLFGAPAAEAEATRFIEQWSSKQDVAA
jgi:EAL domain-containing protein (putative c-di-GMP-specific phosphodiesterase class I)